MFSRKLPLVAGVLCWFLGASNGLAVYLRAPSHDWLQWGGPNRNFVVETGDLAPAWPPSGPRELWRRPLGPGHSAILYSDGTLYTAYRADQEDVVTALSAADGSTRWESRYPAPPKPGMQLEFGCGPHSTPLLLDDRLITASATAILSAFNAKTGERLWQVDLAERYGASHMGRGFSNSPLAFDGRILINVSGKEVGVAAFNPENGELVWKSEPIPGSHASGIVAEIGGKQQLIFAAHRLRVGLDAHTGETLWKLEADPQFAAVMCTPVFVEPDRVLVTAAYGGGAQVLQIKPSSDGKSFEATQLWHNRRLKVQHGNALCIGPMAFGSSGDFGPAILTAVRLDDGEALWRERGFPKSTLVQAADKIVLLSEQGELALCSATPERFEIHSRARVLSEKAWTVPTLVGTTLYVRDNQDIAAFDLSRAANSN